MRPCRVGLVPAVCAALTASAQAAPAKGALPPADDLEAAKAHFAAGSAYYDQANYADAVKEFNEAYRLSHRTDLLYNIAVCYERLSDFDDAIGALRKYLEDKPDAPDRVTIQTRIANLERRKSQAPRPGPAPLASDPVAQPAPVAAAAAPAERRGGKRWYAPGVALLGVGVGLGAVSLGTGLASHAIHNRLEVQCIGGLCGDNLRAEVDLGRTLGITSDVFLGLGLAAGATGIVLLVVQSRPVVTAK
jgi:tetratricopeptide (TPR) repeat protein